MSITFSARVLRKQNDLPRYIVVPAKLVVGQEVAFTAQVRLDDGPVFERNVRPWGQGSDVFFFNLTAAQCSKAGVDTGDQCDVRIEEIG